MGWGWSQNLFLGRPGAPQGRHMDQVLTLPITHLYSYVDYILEGDVQNHRLIKSPRSQRIGEMVRVKGSLAPGAGSKLYLGNSFSLNNTP